MKKCNYAFDDRFTKGRLIEMKKIKLLAAISLMIMIWTLPVFAGDETLFSGNVEHGGFGGPVVKFTQIKDEFGVLVGGRGGWIINHSFVLGAGGYGDSGAIPQPI
jgi:hypothetical protein